MSSNTFHQGLLLLRKINLLLTLTYCFSILCLWQFVFFCIYLNNFNFCIGDFGDSVSGNTWRPTDFNINWNTGNVGMGILNTTYKLNVNGSINCNEIYGNGTPITSTLSFFLPLTGGLLSGTLTG